MRIASATDFLIDRAEEAIEGQRQAAAREFKSLGDFARYLGDLERMLRPGDRRALRQAARLLQKHAKAKFGEYQPQAGSFVAWAQLAQSTMDERARLGYPEDEPLLREGELRASIERQSDDREAQVGSNDDIMVLQELGTSRMPPRSVLGSTGVECAEEVAKLVGWSVYLALTGEGMHEGSMKAAAVHPGAGSE